MEAKGRYISADVNMKSRKKVARLARVEKVGRAVMAGRLIERGLAEYEKSFNKEREQQ